MKPQRPLTLKERETKMFRFSFSFYSFLSKYQKAMKIMREREGERENQSKDLSKFELQRKKGRKKKAIQEKKFRFSILI